MNLALDHLILAGPDLDRLVAETARTTGTAPVAGGSHPGQGTRNALLGLVGGCYLELMAPDPEGRRGDFLASIEDLRNPQLHAWCVRTDDADACARRIEAAGARVRRMEAGRDLPSGDRLEWELLFPSHHDFAGLTPFFIDWRGSPHPAESLSAEVELRLLSLRHPRPAELADWLQGLGIGSGFGATADEPRIETAEAPGRAMRGDFSARRGPFALRGAAGGIRTGVAQGP